MNGATCSLVTPATWRRRRWWIVAESARVVHADCIEAMRQFDESCIDAIVTDPPYGLEFMGKDWDRPWAVSPASGVGYEGRDDLTLPTHRDTRNANCRRCGGRQRGARRCECETPEWDRDPSEDMRAFQAWTETWAREAYRILKPGGHLLAFGGTRTSHRVASGIEDAGFEIRDVIAWMYGSGFPKSLDVARAIDKAQGVEGNWRREDHPSRPGARQPSEQMGARIGQADHTSEANPEGIRHMYEPETEEARRWHGWGTALKPSYEPVVVARKPLNGTVAANVLAHGTGGINVDGCRIASGADYHDLDVTQGGDHFSVGSDERTRGTTFQPSAGRWPANMILSHTVDCVLVGTKKVRGSNFDGHEGGRINEVYGSDDRPRLPGGYADDDGMETVEEWECSPDCPVALLDAQSGDRPAGAAVTGTEPSRTGVNAYHEFGRVPFASYDDSGGASRFFYCPKTSRAERNAGLDEFPERDRSAVIGQLHEGESAAGNRTGRYLPRRNDHPTVKPIELMRWLIRLVTPPGGTVLDPFTGSGTTGCAAVLEPAVRHFVGIERDDGYVEIARARVRFWREHGEQALEVVRQRSQSERMREELAAAGQLDLFA
jgi:DNA modification methylase